ncbi:MAG TPA: siroheme synthase, partial [Gammaproteobacteria bacterium]|nr:siroheme synthase [Gammaproteobacteria bacterium]
PVTPMALIQQGTTPNQRVWTGTLSTLPLIIKDQAVRPPSMVIVGEVVKLHEKLAWFEPASSTG